jgi:hypothetical protein
MADVYGVFGDRKAASHTILPSALMTIPEISATPGR